MEVRITNEPYMLLETVELLYAIHFARHVRSPVSFWIGSWRKKNCSAGSCLDNPSVAVRRMDCSSTGGMV